MSTGQNPQAQAQQAAQGQQQGAQQAQQAPQGAQMSPQHQRAEAEFRQFMDAQVKPHIPAGAAAAPAGAQAGNHPALEAFGRGFFKLVGQVGLPVGAMILEKYLGVPAGTFGNLLGGMGGGAGQPGAGGAPVAQGGTAPATA